MKFLVTYQERGKPRQRLVVLAGSTCDAIIKCMTAVATQDMHLYIAARVATPEDLQLYGDIP